MKRIFKSTDHDKPHFLSYVFMFFTTISASKKERRVKKRPIFHGHHTKHTICAQSPKFTAKNILHELEPCNFDGA